MLTILNIGTFEYESNFFLLLQRYLTCLYQKHFYWKGGRGEGEKGKGKREKKGLIEKEVACCILDV